MIHVSSKLSGSQFKIANPVIAFIALDFRLLLPLTAACSERHSLSCWLFLPAFVLPATAHLN